MGDPAQSGGITYSEWMGALTQAQPVRPRCPECGSNHIISNGAKWNCRTCGNYWMKIHTGRKGPDYSQRPPCPDCGAHYAAKNGSRGWICGKCGKQWKYS